MIFLRRTLIYTVDFVMKDGATVTAEFYEFSWKYNADDTVTSIKYRTATGLGFYIKLHEISAIVVQSKRVVWRWRHSFDS